MASHRVVALIAVCALTASGTAAQTPSDALTPIQVAVACAPPPVLASVPMDASRIIGSQDTVPRTVFGAPELLVISGGTDRGLLLGQEYFVRRVLKSAGNYNDKVPHQVHTIGWLRVVAVNATTAIASVDHACGDILAGDYIEPFQMPQIPNGDITAVDTTREPDFSSIGRVLYGSNERRSAGPGDYMLIDRGADQSVELGAPYAIYRDLGIAGTPLTAIGEATVVSIGPTMALVRINRSRDAVMSGDLAIPRSK
jgi:hypothetical protein